MPPLHPLQPSKTSGNIKANNKPAKNPLLHLHPEVSFSFFVYQCRAEKKIQLEKKSFEKGDFRCSLLRSIQIYLLTCTDFKISLGVSMFLFNVFFIKFIKLKIKYRTYLKLTILKDKNNLINLTGFCNFEEVKRSNKLIWFIWAKNYEFND